MRRGFLVLFVLVLLLLAGCVVNDGDAPPPAGGILDTETITRTWYDETRFRSNFEIVLPYQGRPWKAVCVRVQNMYSESIGLSATYEVRTSSGRFLFSADRSGIVITLPNEGDLTCGNYYIDPNPPTGDIIVSGHIAPDHLFDLAKGKVTVSADY